MLRTRQPDHVLLQAAQADASTGLLDIGRLGHMLSRISGQISHCRLDHVSPLAVPVLMEMGKEPIRGAADDDLLSEAAARNTRLIMEPAG